MNLLPLFQMSTNWVQPYSSFLQEVFLEQLEVLQATSHSSHMYRGLDLDTGIRYSQDKVLCSRSLLSGLGKQMGMSVVMVQRQ